MGKYSYSTDQENYHGSFDTIEAACQEAASEIGVGDSFWVGEAVEPPQPESLWDAEDWLEHVSCQDEYCGEWADDWDGSTKEQRQELEAEVRKLMAAWLDRHGLRPRFWNIDKAQEYQVTGRGGEKYVVEAVAPVRRG